MKHEKTTKPFNLKYMFKDLFRGSEDHVRISEVGHYILDNKELASAVANLIVDKKEDLESGEKFTVPNGTFDIEISLSTVEKDSPK